MPVQVLNLKYQYKFDPEKAYLMVGCLGGIGRSLSKWMLDLGARKFYFLGRSGVRKTEAMELVEDLEQAGGKVTVIKGDVCQKTDVDNAVAQIQEPVGGVIHAAMGLDVSFHNNETSRMYANILYRKRYSLQCLRKAGTRAFVPKSGALGTCTTRLVRGSLRLISSS